MKPILCLLSFSLVLGACSRTIELPQTLPGTQQTLVIKNNSSIPINYLMYSNLNDFAENGAVFIDQRLMPGEQYVRQLTDAEMLGTYYSDWYSDDYTYARWNNNGHMAGKEYTPEVIYLPYLSSNPPTLQITDEDLQANYHSDLRRRFLKGNETSTSWKVIDIYKQKRLGTENEPISVWNTSTPAMRSLQLTVRKDLTATLTTDSATRTDLRFQTTSLLQDSSMGPHLFFTIPNIGSMRATGKILGRNTVRIDSVIVFDDSYTISDEYDYYYILKRK